MTIARTNPLLAPSFSLPPRLQKHLLDAFAHWRQRPEYTARQHALIGALARAAVHFRSPQPLAHAHEFFDALRDAQRQTDVERALSIILDTRA